MNQSHRLELVSPRQEDYASLVDWIGDAHARARWAAAAQVTLRVYRDNPAAIALYRRFGFTEVPQESDEAVFFMRASVAGMPFEITCPTSPN